MFPLRRNRSGLTPIQPADESRLIESLNRAPQENAYLLGLLRDFGVRPLLKMKWGEFHLLPEPFPQVLYQDVTGLVVLSETSIDGVAVFAEHLDGARIRTTRIIARAESAVGLHQRLSERSGRWAVPRAEFEEWGMALQPTDLQNHAEPRLRLAFPEEARDIAAGSAQAMLEEIGIETSPREMDRLVRGKADLIEKNRYYVLDEGGKIVFQAYLSASLPHVAQVQGVWVVPEMRNRGLATRCLSEMAGRCLKSSQCVVLRVQKRNHPAVRSYEKVGFTPFLEYRSIWFN